MMHWQALLGEGMHVHAHVSADACAQASHGHEWCEGRPAGGAILWVALNCVLGGGQCIFAYCHARDLPSFPPATLSRHLISALAHPTACADRHKAHWVLHIPDTRQACTQHKVMRAHTPLHTHTRIRTHTHARLYARTHTRTHAHSHTSARTSQTLSPLQRCPHFARQQTQPPRRLRRVLPPPSQPQVQELGQQGQRRRAQTKQPLLGILSPRGVWGREVHLWCTKGGLLVSGEQWAQLRLCCSTNCSRCLGPWARAAYEARRSIFKENLNFKRNDENCRGWACRRSHVARQQRQQEVVGGKIQ